MTCKNTEYTNIYTNSTRPLTHSIQNETSALQIFKKTQCVLVTVRFEWRQSER